jgi:arylsulfatase A-like enzyme
MIHHAIKVVFSLVALLHLTSRTLAAEQDQPNIVLVMADDLGWSDIGCYGGEIETPHIGSLAKEGLRFTQFYNNAICGPTRLNTGRKVQRSGFKGSMLV